MSTALVLGAFVQQTRTGISHLVRQAHCMNWHHPQQEKRNGWAVNRFAAEQLHWVLLKEGLCRSPMATCWFTGGLAELVAAAALMWRPGPWAAATISALQTYHSKSWLH